MGAWLFAHRSTQRIERQGEEDGHDVPARSPPGPIHRQSLYVVAMIQATQPSATGRQTLIVRPGRRGDAEGLFRLAKAAGSGMTNLQPDLALLSQRLDTSETALVSEEARAAGAAILFVVERAGEVVGTACVFPRIGVEWPFYSYRLTRQAQTHRALRKTVAHDMLILANDFDGQAEVGGLFVDADVRGAAAGRLTARARYLFLAEHRSWFGRLVISDLRGWQDAQGASPVWEALGREFYAMDFTEADHMNALVGNQFIADLSPKHPIYASLLPPAAREALGRPHDDGRGAMRLLLGEGFRHEGYVDIFDGGPTLCAEIDGLKAVRDCRVDAVAMIRAGVGADDRLVSAGAGAAFRAARGGLVIDNDGLVEVDETLAQALGVGVGDQVRHVAF
jgi:arginine N-succinyltransferase